MNDNSSFCLQILSTIFIIDLQCHVFSFCKAFIQIISLFVCKRSFCLHLTMLQCWAKFSYVLVHWSVRMIRAQNYQNMSKFVKVMLRRLEYCGLFFPDTVYIKIIL